MFRTPAIRRAAVWTAALVALTGTAPAARAGLVLIVNGASGTSEPGTTANITTNLSNLHIAAGNTVSVVDTVPGDLSSFAQVWDIRFSNNLAITAAQQAQYLAYLQSGRGMFVMGENSAFPTRNNSVLGLIAAAGGGSLTFTTPSSTQTVFAPFTGPNAVSSVTYAAPGGVTSAGTGQFVTGTGTATSGTGSGLAFAVGTLANATAGALTVVFDVNFMQEPPPGAGNGQLVRNLIGFIGDQVDPPSTDVPAPPTVVLAAIGGACGLLRLRRRAAGAA
jgi:hypothetical protein